MMWEKGAFTVSGGTGPWQQRSDQTSLRRMRMKMSRTARIDDKQICLSCETCIFITFVHRVQILHNVWVRRLVHFVNIVQHTMHLVQCTIHYGLCTLHLMHFVQCTMHLMHFIQNTYAPVCKLAPLRTALGKFEECDYEHNCSNTNYHEHCKNMSPSEH